MSKREVLERVERRKSAAPQDKIPDDSYISLTEIACAHSEDAPGYVIQRWLRSKNTLVFLNLWEKENNPNYRDSGYIDWLYRIVRKEENRLFYINAKIMDRADKGDRDRF